MSDPRLVESTTERLKHRLALGQDNCAALNGARSMRLAFHGRSKRMAKGVCNMALNGASYNTKKRN